MSTDVPTCFDRATTPPHASAGVHLVNIGMHHARRNYKRGHALSTLLRIRDWRVAMENIGFARMKIARSLRMDLRRYEETIVGNVKPEGDKS